MAKRGFSIPSLSDMESEDNDLVAMPSKMLFTQRQSQKNSVGNDKAPNQAGKTTDGEIAGIPVPIVSSSSSYKPPGLALGAASGASSLTSDPSPGPSLSKPAPIVGLSTVPSASAGLPTASSASLIVSQRQRGNPLLKQIRNVTWEFGDIIADYQMSPARCALFLSLRYHAINPDYIHERLKKLGHSYELRVLLVQCDVQDPQHALRELASIALLSDCTLLVAWSSDAAARYLETYKSYEDKPPDLIMEKTERDFIGRVTDVLTTVKKVNKTDAATLLATFGTMKGIVEASKEELILCPGLGPQKAQRLHDVFHEPFLKTNKQTKKQVKPIS